MGKKQSPTNNLIFPSGRSVIRCKADAKEIRKQSKNTSEYISLNRALDIVATENGIDLPWDKALSSLIDGASKEEAQFRSMSGRIKGQESHYKKDVLESFSHDGKLMLSNGEGGWVEAYQHNGLANGLVVTKELDELINKDIEQLGGFEALKSKEGSGLQILYEKVDSKSHLAHEFHLDSKGTIFYYCRSQPWSGYEAEYHARGHEIQTVGWAPRPIDTALHLVCFTYFHQFLSPKVLTL